MTYLNTFARLTDGAGIEGLLDIYKLPLSHSLSMVRGTKQVKTVWKATIARLFTRTQARGNFLWIFLS